MPPSLRPPRCGGLAVPCAGTHRRRILQDADERTGGRPGFEIPTLYRALKRMGEAGLIERAEAPKDENARREHWRATALGREVLREAIRRLEVLVAAGRTLNARTQGAS